MAQVHPSMPPHRAFTAGLATELRMLEQLAEGLPDAYTLFHSVDWSAGTGVAEQHGEVDIVVLNQAGDLLLVEVKAGDVEFRDDGIFKTYGPRRRDVTAQARQQYGALRARLQDAGLRARLHHLLVMPDVRVATSTVAWPRERIVDAGDLPALARRVGDTLGPGLPAPDLRRRVHAFLENRFQVVPDVSAMAGRLIDASDRLGSGLATWVPRISTPSGLLRVLGTAGSGKTQLALRLLREADARGQRAAYLCFNRALADHVARIAPVRTPAETFHEYAVHVNRRAGLPVDFTQPGVFDRVAGACMELVRQAQPDLDLIVIDECQDLQPEWVEALLMRLRSNGRAVLLEDPSQQLYADREPFELPEAVTIRSSENYRSPRAIVRLANLLRLCEEPVVAGSPYEGDVPDPITYADDADCLRATQTAVQRCLDRGFGIGEIAVISLKGRERSALLQRERLGPWVLRRFTGRYAQGGEPVWTEGELLADSVRRFKGQAVPAVVLTECEFDTLDDLTRRLLFVGLTRARVGVEWVMGQGAASAVEAVAYRQG